MPCRAAAPANAAVPVMVSGFAAESAFAAVPFVTLFVAAFALAAVPVMVPGLPAASAFAAVPVMLFIASFVAACTHTAVPVMRDIAGFAAVPAFAAVPCMSGNLALRPVAFSKLNLTYYIMYNHDGVFGFRVKNKGLHPVVLRIVFGAA